MGNHQSCQEIVTEARAGANKNTDAPFIQITNCEPVVSINLPSQSQSQSQSKPDKNAGLGLDAAKKDTKDPSISSTGTNTTGTTIDNYRRKSNKEDKDMNHKTSDPVIIAKMDPITKAKAKSKSKKVSASANKPDLFRKKKRRAWFPWKKKREHKPMITTGLTFKLDSKHNMLIYLPKKVKPAVGDEHEHVQQKNTKPSVEDITIAALPDLYSTIFGENVKKTRTKLVVKDMDEIRGVVSMRMKARKDCYVDPCIVTGLQLFVMRHYGPDDNDNEREHGGSNTLLQEAAPHPQSRLPWSGAHGFVPNQDMKGMNILQPTTLDPEKIEELLTIFRNTIGVDFDKKEEQGRGQYTAITADALSSSLHKQEKNNLSEHKTNFSRVYSAIIPRGIGKVIFAPERVINNLVDPVEDMICIDQESHIYVCDIGLTSVQCDLIVDTTERCSRGHYSAYTYAKQTLGCRDHDELATICEWPVLRAYSSIVDHLDKRLNNKDGSGVDRQLVLDEREPHLVKYDTSKKERMKLDMHTDKSEWTFIIALSDGDGGDYDGGGTYIECIDTTVNLQKGHALIFPGRRRHRGQKIVNGLRFLLVGFLVEQRDIEEHINEGDDYDDYMNAIF